MNMGRTVQKLRDSVLMGEEVRPSAWERLCSPLPSVPPGEHCEEHVAFFKQVFGDQALMRPTTL